MARLGEILLSEKFITSRELDAALEIHVLHGVKLGTCLVEMGYVSDEALAKCLTKKTGKTFLSKDQLLVFGSQNLAVISPNAIKRHRIIPIGVCSGALRIATDHELTPKKQIELEKFIGRSIEPVAVSGYALDCFLEQIFGMQRPGRFLANYSKAKTPEKAPVIEQKRSFNPKPIIINGVEWKSLSDVTQDEESTQINEDIFNTSLNRDDVPISLSDVAKYLSNAKSRDDVAKTILEYLTHSSENAALFIINDGGVRGWKAYSDRIKLPEFETFSAPLDALPDLRQCVVTKKPYVGNLMTEQLKLLLQKRHYDRWRPVFFPIFVQQRIVAVLLCEGSESLNPFETEELCLKASYALEILILRSKLLSS